MIGEIEVLRQEIQSLGEKNELLRSGIDQAQTDIYWEEKSREQGYIKEGEEAVVVIPPEEQSKEEAEEKSFWDKVKERIGF